MYYTSLISSGAPKNILATLFLFVFATAAFSQFDADKVKAHLIFRLCENIKWSAESSIDTFRIGLLTDNMVTTGEFIQILKLKKLKGKPATTVHLGLKADLSRFHILYVGQRYQEQINTVWEAADSLQMLIITENFDRYTDFMINLFDVPREKRIAYIVNKEALLTKGFNYNPDLILFGGTMVDLREMYTQADMKLARQNQTIELLGRQIDSQNQAITRMNKQIAELEINIDRLREVIGEKEAEYMRLSQEIEEKELLLALKSGELADQQKLVRQIGKEISRGRKEMEESQEQLSRLKAEGEKKQEEISSMTQVLNVLSINIKNQRTVIFGFASISLLLLITIFYAFNTYLKKRKAYIDLESLNDELVAVNDQLNVNLLQLKEQQDEIEQLNEELIASNDDLYSKRESLEETLKKLRQAQDYLVQSQKMASLGLLTSGIAHEINNPVNFISAGIHALTDSVEISRHLINKLMKALPQVDNDKIKSDLGRTSVEKLYGDMVQILNNMEYGVDRITDIIRDISSYSRHADVFVDDHNLAESINNALMILKNRTKYIGGLEKNIGPLPALRCIPGRMEQVFVNVISNALDAIDNNGHVSVKARYDKERKLIEVIVSDDGHGIDQKDKDRLFDPFFTTKETGKGTGLGLYIAYGIIEEHQGTLKIHSKKGEGTDVIIGLPVH